MLPVLRAIQTSMPQGMLNVIFSKNQLYALTANTLVKASSFREIKEQSPKEIASLFLNASHFFSFQNGIAYNDDDFIKITKAFNRHAIEKSCIAYFYHPSDGAFLDLKRVASQKLNVATERTDTFKKVFPKFLKLIAFSHKDPQIIHFAHSEAGLIFANSHPVFDDEILDLTKRHLEVITLGSAKPVSPKNLKKCINIYSNQDYLTLPAIYLYQTEEKAIKIVPSISDRDEKHLYFIDHAALGKTYFEIIKKKLEDPDCNF